MSYSDDELWCPSCDTDKIRDHVQRECERLIALAPEELRKHLVVDCIFDNVYEEVETGEWCGFCRDCSSDY